MIIAQRVYYGNLVIPTPISAFFAAQAQTIGRQIRMVPTNSDNGRKASPPLQES
jgi:hypothetical protein